MQSGPGARQARYLQVHWQRCCGIRVKAANTCRKDRCPAPDRSWATRAQLPLTVRGGQFVVVCHPQLVAGRWLVCTYRLPRSRIGGWSLCGLECRRGSKRFSHGPLTLLRGIVLSLAPHKHSFCLKRMPFSGPERRCLSRSYRIPARVAVMESSGRSNLPYFTTLNCRHIMFHLHDSIEGARTPDRVAFDHGKFRVVKFARFHPPQLWS